MGDSQEFEAQTDPRLQVHEHLGPIARKDEKLLVVGADTPAYLIPKDLNYEMIFGSHLHPPLLRDGNDFVCQFTEKGQLYLGRWAIDQEDRNPKHAFPIQSHSKGGPGSVALTDDSIFTWVRQTVTRYSLDGQQQATYDLPGHFEHVGAVLKAEGDHVYLGSMEQLVHLNTLTHEVSSLRLGPRPFDSGELEQALRESAEMLAHIPGTEDIAARITPENAPSNLQHWDCVADIQFGTIDGVQTLYLLTTKGNVQFLDAYRIQEQVRLPIATGQEDKDHVTLAVNIPNHNVLIGGGTYDENATVWSGYLTLGTVVPTTVGQGAIRALLPYKNDALVVFDQSDPMTLHSKETPFRKPHIDIAHALLV